MVQKFNQMFKTLRMFTSNFFFTCLYSVRLESRASWTSEFETSLAYMVCFQAS